MSAPREHVCGRQGARVAVLLPDALRSLADRLEARVATTGEMAEIRRRIGLLLDPKRCHLCGMPMPGVLRLEGRLYWAETLLGQERAAPL